MISTSWLTKRNLSIAKSLGVALLFGLIIYQEFKIVDFQDDIAKVPCFIVRNHPDSDGQDYADLRQAYNCPAFDPGKIRRFPQSTKSSTPSSIPSSRPGATDTQTIGPPAGQGQLFPKPSPSRNQQASSAAPSAPVATRTVPGPTRTRQVPARTSTATITRTPTPPQSTRVPKPLCSPLALPIGLGC